MPTGPYGALLDAVRGVRWPAARRVMGATLDAPASMAFPLPGFDKWRLSREVAVGLASVAHAEADPVGLAIAGAGQTVLAPRARRSVLLEMMRALDATTPAGSTPVAPFIS